MTQVAIFHCLMFAVGAAVGSFLNVVIHRLPRKESVVSPPSRCPACGNRIRWHDNVPILGWLLLRGRCRDCGSPISSRYPLVELGNALLTLALSIKFGPGLTFLVLFIFCSALLAITVIDLDHQIIPDVISLPGILAGFVASFWVVGVYSRMVPWWGIVPAWVDSLVGIVLGGGIIWLITAIYYLVRKEEGMGGGDIKLLAMIGAFLGWKAVIFSLFAGCLTGSIIGLTLMRLQGRDGKMAIPFGPFLASGAVLFIFFGRQVILWYLRLGR